MRRIAALTLLVLGIVSLGACSVNDLAFREDRRLRFVSPEDREQVSLPVTIDWEVEDFQVVGEGGQAAGSDGGYFGVFVDQTPQPPGEPLTWFARDDETCQQDPECPDAEYLEMRRIYTTHDTEFTIEVLPRSAPEGRRDMHEVTVILLDADGDRVGESAWRLEFEVNRGPDA